MNLKNYDGQEMTVRELIGSTLLDSPFIKVYYNSNHIEEEDILKYVEYKGKFVYYEDEDGYDDDGPIIIPYLIFEIGGK